MSRKPSAPPEPQAAPLAFVPTRVFFTGGRGVHEHQRVALQHALREAGFGDCNLVKVSSVLPPGCRVIDRAEAEGLLRPGNVLFAVIAQAVTQEPHQRLSVGVGWAIPDKDGVPGYVAEVEEDQAKGQSAEAAAAEVGTTAIRLLAERLRARVDADALWAKRRGGFEIGRVRRHRRVPDRDRGRRRERAVHRGRRPRGVPLTSPWSGHSVTGRAARPLPACFRARQAVRPVTE